MSGEYLKSKTENNASNPPEHERADVQREISAGREMHPVKGGACAQYESCRDEDRAEPRPGIQSRKYFSVFEQNESNAERKNQQHIGVGVAAKCETEVIDEWTPPES